MLRLYYRLLCLRLKCCDRDVLYREHPVWYRLLRLGVLQYDCSSTCVCAVLRWAHIKACWDCALLWYDCAFIWLCFTYISTGVYRLLRPGGQLCLIGLTYGDTLLSRLATGTLLSWRSQCCCLATNELTCPAANMLYWWHNAINVAVNQPTMPYPAIALDHVCSDQAHACFRPSLPSINNAIAFDHTSIEQASTCCGWSLPPVWMLCAGVWNAIYAVRPQVVGGCRPQNLVPYLESEWNITTVQCIPGSLLRSQVIVANKVWAQFTCGASVHWQALKHYHCGPAWILVF